MNVNEERYILEQLLTERARQERMWGTDFDDRNTLNDWATYIVRYVSGATGIGVTPAATRTQLVKAGALIVAAIGAYDRNKAFPPRHYDAKTTTAPEGAAGVIPSSG